MDGGSQKTKTQRRYIYVIVDGSGASKIGIAENPRKRLMDLQVGSSVKLYLAYSLSVPYQLAKVLEGKLHRRLKHLHLSGEWFFIDPTVAAKALYEIVMGPDEEDVRKADKWARELWGTKVICPQCSHWRVVRKSKKELIGKKFKCGKCGFVHAKH